MSMKAHAYFCCVHGLLVRQDIPEPVAGHDEHGVLRQQLHPPHIRQALHKPALRSIASGNGLEESPYCRLDLGVSQYWTKMSDYECIDVERSEDAQWSSHKSIGGRGI